MPRRLPAIPFPLLLCGLALLAYGLWIPRLGLYWDDFPLSWIARTFGGEGLRDYFATNRPFWGLLYQITTPLLGSHPLAWQVFGLSMRLLDALLLWQVLRLVWPQHEEAARWSAALMLVYPGFSQQFISVIYGHMELVLAAFLGSLALMVVGLRRGRAGIWLLVLSFLLSAVNVFCMEYFLLLELARPLLIFVVIGGSGEYRWGRRVPRSALIWLPFFLLFLAAVAWRTWGLGFQTYQPAFAERVSQTPWQALGGLLGRVAADLWLSAGLAWAQPFRSGGLAELTRTQTLVFWAVTGLGLLLSLAGFLPRVQPARDRRGWPGLLLFGLGLLVLAGGPYWLTDLPITAEFPFDRFTLSFLTGACILLGGGLALLPLPRGVRVAVLALFLAGSVTLQYRHALVYARDWASQRAFFRQLTWRAPSLAPGTTLLFNELPFVHYSDNSLTAPLNWIYAPENRTRQMAYVLYYPTVRLGSGLPRIEPGLEIRQNYLAAEFRGSTAQVIVLYYQPPGCLRVMDPEVEVDGWLIPSSLRDTLPLSSTAPILPVPQAQLPAHLYGPEPGKNWCWYFEKADLARQQGEWERVAELGEEAFALGDYPNDPLERFPFIEAYAHLGRWEEALELTRQTNQIAEMYGVQACRLWGRIARETGADSEQAAAVAEARSFLPCPAGQ